VTLPAPTRAERGMTVIELMIAMVILGIVVAAAFSVAFVIMNNYREHRRATVVERSARGAMAVLAEAVRNASPGVPTGKIFDLVGCDLAEHAIRVVNGVDAPDSIDLIYARPIPMDDNATEMRQVVTSLRAPYTDASASMVLEDGSLLKPGDQILVTDFATGALVKIQSIVQAGPDWNVTLTGGTPQTMCATPPPGGFNYPARATVIRAQRARFFVDTALSILKMDPTGGLDDDVKAVAEGVEDLQIAIGVNRTGGSALDETAGSGDDDDWVFNHPDDATLPDLLITPWRAIRLTVIARSTEDTSLNATSLRPGAEDRADATVPDVFRRRVLSTIIELRNLRGSP
jgi:prepilin-type N-terminal cleavage/methylation domain-containing protein